MRYFIRVCKTFATVAFQINNKFATYLRKGEKRGAIRVHGMNANYSGSGWYRIVIESRFANELKSAMEYLRGRFKNYKMLASFKPVEENATSMFAFETGMLSPAILRMPRVLVVKYEKRGAHKVATVINRALQASSAFLMPAFVPQTAQIAMKPQSTKLESFADAFNSKFHR